MNHINYNSVRISYFVDEKESDRATSIFRAFFTNNKIGELTENFSPPHIDIIAGGYGGLNYEQRFRNFLANYNQIGLELLQGNLLHSRRLFAVYRFQVRQAPLSFEEFFEPTFNKYSPTYLSFSDKERLQFLAALKEWPSPRYQYSEWTHMMVNMIEGRDWPFSQYSLSMAQINEILKKDNMGFEIPLSWNPQSFDS